MSNYSARSLRDLNIGTSYANVASFVGRVLSSAIFILFGLSKLSAPTATMGYIASAGLPLPALGPSVS